MLIRGNDYTNSLVQVKVTYSLFFQMAQQPLVGPGLLIIEASHHIQTHDIR
jgi:hypothetical protein